MVPKTAGRIQPNFLEEDMRDVIACFKFGDDRFRGLASVEGHILPFPIDFDGRPYNTLTLQIQIQYRLDEPAEPPCMISLVWLLQHAAASYTRFTAYSKNLSC